MSEYFIDEAANKLYFYPPVPLVQWGAEGAFLTQGMTSANVTADHVVLRGLAIRHSRCVAKL